MEDDVSVSELTPPLNVTQLNARLAQAAAELGIPVARARVMLCTLIVSQMLPDAAAVKGGMGVKLRFGERGTRATSDLEIDPHAWKEIDGELVQFGAYFGFGDLQPVSLVNSASRIV